MNNNNTTTPTSSSSLLVSNQPTSISNASLVFENGTIMGAVMECNHSASITHNTDADHHSCNIPAGEIPEIVISSSHNHSAAATAPTTAPVADSDAIEDTAIEESTALLASHSHSPSTETDHTIATTPQTDDFEQFVLNRSSSESNILESSIYSELQFPPSIGHTTAAGYLLSNGSTTQQQLAANANAHELVDLLNTSTCSRESSSRASSKRSSRRKYKTKTAKWNGATNGAQDANGAYPPQYTAIFLEHGNTATLAANAMGQIANAAATTPFLNAPLTEAAYLQQQYQLLSGPYAHIGRHLHHRRLIDPSLSPPLVNDNVNSLNTSNTAPNATNLAPTMRSTFRKCFSRPVVPFVIGIFALGGAACTLGGVVLGATGLIEHTTQYLSASLLMIGIGLSLLIVAGIIWRLSTPNEADECPCYRLMETCRNCNSPYCNNRLLTGSYLYPEFQHRPPPPSYLTSLHECAAIGLLNGAVYSGLRMNTPPPLYRSTNSLSVLASPANINTPPVPSSVPVALNSLNSGVTNHSGTSSIPLAYHNPADLLPPAANVININAVIENLQAQAQAQAQTQSQALTKEINYLELD